MHMLGAALTLSLSRACMLPPCSAPQCDCARCKVEMADEQGEPAPAETGHVDLTYVSLFVLKHTCERCLGTMAPEPPVGGLSRTACVCNRCGMSRSEAEFMERVQEHFEGGDDVDGSDPIEL